MNIYIIVRKAYFRNIEVDVVAYTSFKEAEKHRDLLNGSVLEFAKDYKSSDIIKDSHLIFYKKYDSTIFVSFGCYGILETLKTTHYGIKTFPIKIKFSKI